MTTPNDLVAEHIRLDNFCDAQEAALKEHLKPHRERMEQIKNELLALSLDQKVKSFKCDEGTAIRSEIMQPRATDKMALLDFCLENWDERGDLVQIGAPAVAAVRAWMDAHNGSPPPAVQVEFINRMSIRKS